MGIVYFFHCMCVCIAQQYLIMTRNKTFAIVLNGPVYQTLYLVTLYAVDAFWVRLYYIWKSDNAKQTNVIKTNKITPQMPKTYDEQQQQQQQQSPIQLVENV